MALVSAALDGAVTLQPFGARDPWADLVRLQRWLERPHVARWFNGPDDHLDFASGPPPGGAQAWIASDGEAVGYLRWQRVDRANLDAVGLTDIPAGAVDIDLFLGEAQAIGRGIGPSARRAFEKAGFALHREDDAPGFGRCWLLVQRLDSRG